ncbi:MAG TPA: hypothetical protein VGD64_16225 [Acidisarcina sp.]
MKTILAVFLCLLIPATSIASEGGYRVAYDGGSLPALKTGTSIRLFIEPNQIRVMGDKEDLLTLPASSITEISYGQDVHRRVGTAIGLAVISLGIGALMLFSKSKKHFVGVTWVDGDKKGGFVMQCDKNEYRGILAGLEGVTGKKAVDSDAMNVKN